MYSLIFILVSAFLFTTIPFGDAVFQCYRCDEPLGKECDNPKLDENLITNCTDKETTCFSRRMEENGITKIQRGCGENNPCISGTGIPIYNDTSTCTKCDADLCNGNKENAAFSNFNFNFSTALLSSIMYFCVKKLL